MYHWDSENELIVTTVLDCLKADIIKLIH